MKLLLILATAITLAAAGSRSYRIESHHRHNNRESERDRRTNLDYEDIETADQDHVERFDEPSERSDSRKSNRIGVYSTHSTANSIQVAKNKAQRRHGKLSIKDSEASGTQFDSAHYGAYQQGHLAQQVQQIHTHQLLTNQGLVPIYQNSGGQILVGGGSHIGNPHAHAHHPQGNIVLTSGLGVQGLGEAGRHGQMLVAGGGPDPIGNPHHHPKGNIVLTSGPIGNPPFGPFGNSKPEIDHHQVPHPGDNELGSDITKSVYVFSAPPDPYDYVPRQTLTKLPQRPQKHYQVLFINAPTPPPPQQHHIELGPGPELKTLVYVLVKKPPQSPPINFIKPGPPHPHKPEVYFIRYKNRGAYGLTPSALGPVEETLPGGHPGVQYAPINPQEEIRGNIDYGPALSPQFDAPAHPYDLEAYHHQDDSNLSATQVLTHRSSNREVDAGVSGI